MKRIYAILSLIMFFQLLVSQTERPIVRKEPWLIYKGETDKMNILWQTNEFVVCNISWGIDTSYSSGNQDIFAYTYDFLYNFEFTELTPGTEYFYHLEMNGAEFASSFFSAPGDNASSLNFFTYSDCQYYPAIHDVIASHILNTADEDDSYKSLIVAAGDLVDQGNMETHWDSLFFADDADFVRSMVGQMPFFSCIGNHEQSGDLFVKYFPYPFIQDRYYSFDYGPVHFSILDQFGVFGSFPDQVEWLEDDLATTDKDWKIIYLHSPGYTTGRHSNNQDVQNYIQSLCLEYNVRLVIGGHNHLYARAEVDGIVHITTGGAGANLYTPDPNDPFIIFTEAVYHYCKVNISDNLLTLTAFTLDNEILDSFTINNIPTPQITYVNTGNDRVYIGWNELEFADECFVYSSDNQETGYQIDNTGIYMHNSWSAPVSETERFYIIKAVRN